MDQTQWTDGTDASLTLIQSDQQYSHVDTGQTVYNMGGVDLSGAVTGGFVVQLPDGTTTFVSADSVISTTTESDQTTTQISIPETKPQTQRRQQGGRQSHISQINGGNRQSRGMDTGAVSLLTGQQEHVQQTSLLNPRKQDSAKPTRTQQSSKSAGGAKQQHQVSLLQPNWQHLQEQSVDTTQLSEGALQSLLAESLPDVKPGEKVYVKIDGNIFEILTEDSGAEGSQNLSLQSTDVASMQAESAGIGLAELATLSAEQPTLELTDYQSRVVDGSQAIVHQEQSVEFDQAMGRSQLQGNEQHYIELVQQGQENTVTTDHDGMQVYLVNSVGEQGSQSMVVPPSGIDAKQSVQDILFQTEAQLQEMAAKGFDMSNYQIVLQDDGQQNGTVYLAAPSSVSSGNFGHDLQQQLVSVVNSSGEIVSYTMSQAGGGDMMQSYAYVNSAGTGVGQNNVLTILADPSTLQQHEAGDGQQKSSWSMASEEFDDGEFDSFKMDTESIADNNLIATHVSSESLPIDRCLQAYYDFVSGTKPETLSSVANSTVSKRPQMPTYVPEFCRRTVKDNTLTPAKSSSQMMTVVYTNESGPVIQKFNSRSLLKPGITLAKHMKMSLPADTLSPALSEVEHSTASAKLAAEREGKIIKRKRRGSDEDSYDDSDGNEQTAESVPPLKRREGQKSVVAMDVQFSPTPSKGRGRPRGSGRGGRHVVRSETHRSLESKSTSSSFRPIDLNEPHNYQRGDFVIERKDRYNYESFPVWKIEAGKLLQKYEPVVNDTAVLHKSVSIYSSWSGDVRTNFKAVLVELITTTGRKCEIVKVLDSFLPKPPDDSLEQDSLMELFNLYVQVLLSQAIDPTFFATIEQGQESYYLGPLEQIDNLLIEAEQAILSLISWNEKFKLAMDQRPFYKVTEPHNEMQLSQGCCEATTDASIVAIKNVKFFGPLYDRKSLEVTSEGKTLTSQEFAISQVAAKHLVTYHGLHHFKFLLFKKCQEEVQFIKYTERGKAENEILEDCMKNRVFVQQGLRELKTLLENCSIVITVVTKPDDAPE